MTQAASPPGRASFAYGQNSREVGLHQCPSERKGEGGPVRSLRVPSHVPSHPQTAAKVQGFSPTASEFTAETDWLLAEGGCEPLVRRADSAGTRLLTLDHEELIGRGLGPPDLALSASELAHAGVTSGSGSESNFSVLGSKRRIAFAPQSLTHTASVSST